MSEARPADTQGPSWQGMTWSDWHQLDSADVPVPNCAGLYRLRCHDQPGLIYIGISDRLRSRLGGLRRARHRPDKKGHYAAACVAAFERQGKIVEVSWSTFADPDRRELMGLEADLIAAHRRMHGNPTCQFHGHPRAAG